MKEFLAVFLGNQESDGFGRWQALPEAEREVLMQQGMQGWHGWVQRHAGQIVDLGGPLGKTLRISAAGVAPTRNDLSGYARVRAETHEEAARLFEGHVHFTIFPGDAVEVMECLPIPGQCESM